MSLGIDWDEEAAVEEAARQEKASKARNTSTVAAEPSVANAVAPPVAASSTSPTVAAAPPPATTKAPQSFAESIIRKTEPYWNPIHLKPGVKELKSYEDIDPYATAAHGLAEFFAYQHGVKPILGGLSQGVGNRISNAISGVDPTIKAQVAATNAKIESNEKIAAMKYGQAQGPDRPAVPTPSGRIEPTFDTTPLPDSASPNSPEAIATNAVKQNPLDAYSQEKHGYPLSTLEAASGGPLTTPSEIDIIAQQLKAGRGISVNPIPGTVSNKPPGIPTAVSPMSQLRGQPTTPAPINAAPPLAPNLGGQIGQFDPSRIGQPLQDPLAGGGFQTPTQEIGPRPSLGQAAGVAPPAAPVDLVAAAQSGQDMSQPIKEDVAHMLQEADKTPSEIKVKGLVRDAQGNFQYPPGMSPAAIEGHKAFNQQYPEHARALEAEGKFGILGAGAADNSLNNSYGSALRKEILNEVNQGQLGGTNANYLEKINPAIKALPPETGIGKKLSDLRINNPEGGTKGPLGVQASTNKAGELIIPKEATKIIKSAKSGTPSALIKAGGPALLLMAISNAADAAQKGDMAPSKELGFDLATGSLLAKLLGGPAAAAGALAFGSTSLNSGEDKELARRRRMAPTIDRAIAPPNQR